MPKKLLVLAAMLVTLLGMATPAFAQDPGEVPAQDEVPACVLANACGDRSAEHQAVEQQQPAMAPASDIDQPFSVSPASDEDRSFTITDSGSNHNLNTMVQGCDAGCAARVAQATEEAITGADSDSEAGTDPAAAFSTAMNAARSPGGSPGSGEAAASEQVESPLQGREAAAYRAAFEAAKEAGLDDEAAKEAAEVAVTEASKTRKGGTPSEGIAAAKGKIHKDRTSKIGASDDGSSEEETTEDTDEEVAASGEDGGTGGEDVQTAPADSRAPLLLGGVALLSVGGYAALRFARSRSPVRGRRLVRT